MKWAMLVVIIAGIFTTIWIVGFKEGEKHGFRKGVSHVAEEASRQLHEVLSDGAIIWIQGGVHLLRKCERLQAYLQEVVKK